VTELDISTADDGYELRQRQRLAAPIDEVFDFFADPENLEALTPDRLRFTVERVRGEMGEGAEIDYTLRLHGIPIDWTSRILNWDPPRSFADVQIQGPYRKWEHVHLFVPDGDTTLAVDRVGYDVPGGPLAPLANGLFVRRDLRAIFGYRAQRLAERFGEVEV
jgi:ligand-binding SRPBCC domain-containing protein